MKSGPKLHFLPPAVIALNREIMHHPELQARLRALSIQGVISSADKVAEIAAYVEVVLEELVIRDEEDFAELCNILVTKLQDKRKIIIH